MPSVTVGGTGQFTATATYSDGSTQNLTSSATWASSNTSATELLPSSTPTAAPANPTGYVWASMPGTPDGNGYANGGDPHAVSIFTSVVDGKLYGFLVDFGQNWIAKIDLAGALAATQIATPLSGRNRSDKLHHLFADYAVGSCSFAGKNLIFS